MKEHITMKIFNRFLIILIGFWFVVGSQIAFSQVIKWLRVSDLQSPINEIGSEYENEFPDGNTNFLSWPVKYGIEQNTCRMKGLWIGCVNFDDPVEGRLKSVCI